MPAGQPRRTLSCELLGVQGTLPGTPLGMSVDVVMITVTCRMQDFKLMSTKCIPQSGADSRGAEYQEQYPSYNA